MELYKGKPQSRLPVRLDYYLWCADTWKIIIQKLPIENFHTIYDLCSGWSVKIELALLKSHFQGLAIIFDKSPLALSIHHQFLQQFCLPYKTGYITDNIIHREITVQKADCIIGNHIIDDLLLEEYCRIKLTTATSLFSDPQSLSGIWNEILNDGYISQYVIDQLCRFLTGHIKPNGFIAISHYLGYQECLYHYPQNIKKYNLLLSSLKSKLMSSGLFIDNHKLIKQAFISIPKPYFQKDEIILLQAH
jgi:hypothetical protein